MAYRKKLDVIAADAATLSRPQDVDGHTASLLSRSEAATRGAPERQPDRGTVRERQEDRRLTRPAQSHMSGQGIFDLDFAKIPRGTVMEWKRHSLFGLNDTENQMTVRRFHWEPVPHKMQPHLLGHLCQDDNQHVVKSGLGLYMRPAYLNDDALRESHDNTDHVLGQQLQALRLQSGEQVGVKNTYIKRQTVQIAQPVE